MSTIETPLDRFPDPKSPSHPIPPYLDLAKTSRWLMHEATWGILSTISTDSAMLGAPFGNPQSVADGYYMVRKASRTYSPANAFTKEIHIHLPTQKGPFYGTNSSGIPYFYVSEMDVSQIDAQSNNIVSLTMSEAQLPEGCQATDPESPLCVRLTITGKVCVV